MPLTPFDPTQPADNAYASGGASAIRSLTQLIINFLSVSFNMSTGQILTSAIPNGLPTPYGATGQVLVSTGAATAPVWQAPGNLVTGMVMMWPTGAAPAGWLNCDGSTPLIATYPTLAGVLGTTFGGDGVTTFGLPDLRGRAPVGIGTGTGGGATAWTLNRQAGEETHLLITAETPAHTHSFNWAQFSGQHQNGTQAAGIYPVVTGVGTTASSSTGGGGAHNNLQPSIGINFVIKT